jgi:hypothetical protein
VINNVAYFPLQCALNSKPVMDAVLDCLASNGIQTQENSMTSDAAIIWSVLWNGRMQGNQQVYEHYRAQGKPVICIDVGALVRGQTWKISVNNITANGYYGHLTNLDYDRPSKLGLQLHSNSDQFNSVLIAAQHQKSLQLSAISSIEDWINDQITLVKHYCDRPIVVRAHPRSQLQKQKIQPGVTFQEPVKVPNTYDGFDFGFKYHTVINYNSGVGIQAAIAGCNVIVDQSSLAYPVSSRVENIEQPCDIDRTQWLVEIAHTEYLIEEIKQGIWLTRLHLN